MTEPAPHRDAFDALRSKLPALLDRHYRNSLLYWRLALLSAAMGETARLYLMPTPHGLVALGVCAASLLGNLGLLWLDYRRLLRTRNLGRDLRRRMRVSGTRMPRILNIPWRDMETLFWWMHFKPPPRCRSVGVSAGVRRLPVVGVAPAGPAGHGGYGLGPDRRRRRCRLSGLVCHKPVPHQWRQTIGNTGNAMTQPRNNDHADNLYSPEAEQAVLGALLLRPAALVDVGSLLLDRYFAVPAHRLVFQAMSALGDQGLEADPVAVANRLRETGDLDANVGGTQFLQRLIESCPTSVNLITYARIVERKALLRQLRQAALEILDLIGTEKDVEDILAASEKAIFGIGQARSEQDLADIRDIMRDVLRDLERTHADQTRTPGLPTGFPLLDMQLGGLNKSDLLVLAGRPGMGKSSLGLTIALNVAQHVRTPLQGFKVAIFSLEMSAAQLVQRLLAIESHTDLQNLRVGQFGEDQWATIRHSGAQLANARIFIDDTPGASVGSVRSKTLRLHAREKLDLLVIDYLQLMTAADSGGAPRQQNRQQGNHLHQQRHQEPRTRTGRARAGAVPTEPGRRVPPGQAAHAAGPARKRQHRAGCRCGHVPVPGKVLRSRNHPRQCGRADCGQAPQRRHRHRAPGLQAGTDPVRAGAQHGSGFGGPNLTPPARDVVEWGSTTDWGRAGSTDSACRTTPNPCSFRKKRLIGFGSETPGGCTPGTGHGRPSGTCPPPTPKLYNHPGSVWHGRIRTMCPTVIRDRCRCLVTYAQTGNCACYNGGCNQARH